MNTRLIGRLRARMATWKWRLTHLRCPICGRIVGWWGIHPEIEVCAECLDSHDMATGANWEDAIDARLAEAERDLVRMDKLAELLVRTYWRGRESTASLMIEAAAIIAGIPSGVFEAMLERRMEGFSEARIHALRAEADRTHAEAHALVNRWSDPSEDGLSRESEEA